MRRARLFLAELLLRGAKLLAGDRAGDPGYGAEEDREKDEDEDAYLPVGHPVVMRSAEAERMIARVSEVRPMKQALPEPPLRGSLQARFGRR